MRAWPPTPARSSTAYFDALARHDLEAAGACWAPDGVDELVGQATVQGPDGVRAFFGGLFAAMPDFAMAVEDLIAEGDRVAVLWRASGTFAGDADYQGIAPTGGRVELRGLDLFTVRDGLIRANVAFPDGLGFARQIGMLPRAGHGAETTRAARLQREDAGGAQAGGHARPSRSPTASGASAAACRGR